MDSIALLRTATNPPSHNLRAHHKEPAAPTIGAATTLLRAYIAGAAEWASRLTEKPGGTGGVQRRHLGRHALRTYGLAGQRPSNGALAPARTLDPIGRSDEFIY
jgi:hypothetical protein